MTVLVDWQIRDAIKSGKIKIDPFDENLIQPNSLDVRLGNHFVWYNPSENIIDPYRKDSINQDFSETRAESIIIEPGDFILAETLEVIGLPDDIVATIEGKSSIARLGLSLHQTGGWIDAGFQGTITLEMANVNKRPIQIYSGMPIGQFVFYKTEHAEKPYNKKCDAKYNNQKNATISKYSDNKRS